MRSIQIPAEGKSMEQIEAEAITHTLELTEGNRSAASRILGISEARAPAGEARAPAGVDEAVMETGGLGGWRRR
jgi:hypothetical protein